MQGKLLVPEVQIQFWHCDIRLWNIWENIRSWGIRENLYIYYVFGYISHAYLICLFKKILKRYLSDCKIQVYFSFPPAHAMGEDAQISVGCNWKFYSSTQWLYKEGHDNEDRQPLYCSHLRSIFYTFLSLHMQLYPLW